MESGTQSGNAFNALKESIAGKLDRAAGRLGQSEERSPRGPYNQQASEWLRPSADYVRNFNVKRADMHLRNQIRTYPGRSMIIGLAVAIVAGIFAGIGLGQFKKTNLKPEETIRSLKEDRECLKKVT